MGLRLFFLPNFPGNTFIQEGTFIPDSRVTQVTNLSYTSFFIPQKTCISKPYCIQINNITTFFVKTKNAPPKQISYNCAGAGAIDISNPASVDRCHKMVSEQSTALCTMALMFFISVQKL